MFGLLKQLSRKRRLFCLPRKRQLLAKGPQNVLLQLPKKGRGSDGGKDPKRLARVRYAGSKSGFSGAEIQSRDG